MPERSADWIGQARRDLQYATHAKRHGFHEWACFGAQQAAEEGLKAVYQHLSSRAQGHGVLKLLSRLEAKTDVPEQLSEYGRELDRHYIAARYPHAWPSGNPADYYSERDSAHAIGSSKKIVGFCESLLTSVRSAQ